MGNDDDAAAVLQSTIGAVAQAENIDVEDFVAVAPTGIVYVVELTAVVAAGDDGELPELSEDTIGSGTASEQTQIVAEVPNEDGTGPGGEEGGMSSTQPPSNPNPSGNAAGLRTIISWLILIMVAMCSST